MDGGCTACELVLENSKTMTCLTKYHSAHQIAWAKKKLSRHFDPEDVEIHLPKKNDFGEMSPEEIQEWMISDFAKK